MAEKLCWVDSRRRITIKGLGRGRDKVYFARDEPDGTITLTPAVVERLVSAPAAPR